MNQNIAQVTLLVKDYDEALDFYIRKLGFELIEDTIMSPTKRWVIIAPKNSKGCRLLLAKASNAEQTSRIGNQTGGRVFMFLYTDDIDRDYDRFILNKVDIIRQPSTETYGKVLVFADLYGNLWDLIQPV